MRGCQCNNLGGTIDYILLVLLLYLSVTYVYGLHHFSILETFLEILTQYNYFKVLN